MFKNNNTIFIKLKTVTFFLFNVILFSNIKINRYLYDLMLIVIFFILLNYKAKLTIKINLIMGKINRKKSDIIF
jgi:hypothetical protein